MKGHCSSSDTPSVHSGTMPITSIRADQPHHMAAHRLQVWLCRRLLLSSTAGVFGALLLLAGMFWFSEVASPAVIPQANASGMCGAVPVDTCFACLQKVTSLFLPSPACAA